MAKMTKEINEDLFGLPEAEPTVVAYDHRTLVIHDGRGGRCRFDSSEVNDLMAELGTFLQTDAPPVQIIDLRNRTAV